MENKKLLSILIPTYNRADCLDNCLNSIFSQIDEEISKKIEIIVSNNASTDRTEEIMEKYNEYKNINYKYSSNEENLGPDRNFYKLVQVANSKFCWIFSDDEYLENNKLKLIIDILENYKDDLGVLYLKNKNNVGVLQLKKKNKCKIKEFHDPNIFLQEVNYYITFITGNIFNKDYYNENFDYENYFDSFMSYNYFYLFSIFNSKINIIYFNKIFSSLAMPNGGYKLFKTFGVNFYIILRKFYEYGLSEKTIKIIKVEQCLKFFPSWILNLKNPKNKYYFLKEEKISQILEKEFKNNIVYWMIVYPIINLNYNLGKVYYLFIRILLKIRRILSGK